MRIGTDFYWFAVIAALLIAGNAIVSLPVIPAVPLVIAAAIWLMALAGR
jgi:hypothetical protein